MVCGWFHQHLVGLILLKDLPFGTSYIRDGKHLYIGAAWLKIYIVFKKNKKMTVKEFIACTNYFKKHNNIRARLFIKFLKKEKQAYLLLNAKLPCYKLWADYYIDELWSLKQRHAMKEIFSRLESSWHIFLWPFRRTTQICKSVP